MKLFYLATAAAGLLIGSANVADASDDHFGRHGGRNHARFHDSLEHRQYHRDLDHRQAHRYPLSPGQHDRLHDYLERDAFVDRLNHRRYHRWQQYDYQPYYGGYRGYRQYAPYGGPSFRYGYGSGYGLGGYGLSRPGFYFSW